MIGLRAISLHAGRTQIGDAAALQEFLSEQRRAREEVGRILGMSQSYSDLRARHRSERDTRRGELERGVRDELAAGRRQLEGLLRHGDIDEAKRSEHLAQYDRTYDIELHFGAERKMALLEEEHRVEELDHMKRAAVKIVEADAVAGADSLRASVAGAVDKPGEPRWRGKMVVLASETSSLEKKMTEVEADGNPPQEEAPAEAGEENQVGPGQGQPQGAKMSLSAASCERRLAAMAAVAQSVKELAAEVVALAATVLDGRVSRWALTAAEVAERAKETCIHVFSLAGSLEEKHEEARKESKKRVREGSDAGAEEPESTALKEAEAVENDLHDRVCGLAWRNQRVLLRAKKFLQGMVVRAPPE